MRGAWLCVMLTWAVAILVNGAGDVPVIDVSALLHPTEAGERLDSTAFLIRKALHEHGIFLMTGHDIVGSFADEVMRDAKDLFSLSLEEKLHFKLESSERMRGYIPFGTESGLKDSNFEPKEGWAYGKGEYVAEADTSYLAAPNSWPSQESKEERGALFDVVYDRSVEYCEMIMRALFGDDDMDIEHMMDGGEKISLMRIFHYFVAEAKDEGDSENKNKDKKQILGSSPHRDWGLLTLILQDAPGLEYFDGANWIAVPFIRDSLVVNGGDFLTMISSDKNEPYTSPIHRVLSPTKENRLSFVFFYYPRYDTPLDTRLITDYTPLVQEVELNSEGEGEGKGTEKETKRMEFNTLTSILDDKAISFGDAMITKWLGVQA